METDTLKLFTPQPTADVICECRPKISSRSDKSNMSSFDMAAFSSQLAAVLLDTWKEVAPVTTAKKSGRKRKSRSAASSADDGGGGDSDMSSLLSRDAVEMLDKIVAILHFLAASSTDRWRLGSSFRARLFELLVQPLPFHAAHQGRYSMMS